MGERFSKTKKWGGKKSVRETRNVKAKEKAEPQHEHFNKGGPIPEKNAKKIGS